MKRLLLAILCMVCLTAYGKEKILESSARHRPSWLGGVESEYIITIGEGQDLASAREQAMTRLREEIVSAIATTVHSSTKISLWEVSDNGIINSHREMTSEQSVRAADIPYLADVSASHATDYYWAKIRREDRSIVVVYHIKYPLSDETLSRLVAEYEASQQQINDALQTFASVNMADYDDLGTMLQQYSALKTFDAGLREDDPRHAICGAVRRGYEQMLWNNLHLEALVCTRDSSFVRLLYGTKPIKAHTPPKVQSNCLTEIQVRQNDEGALVTYDYNTGCYADEQNYLTVAYTIIGRKIAGKFYIQ